MVCAPWCMSTRLRCCQATPHNNASCANCQVIALIRAKPGPSMSDVTHPWALTA
jgi:hypothetical protein